MNPAAVKTKGNQATVFHRLENCEHRGGLDCCRCTGALKGMQILISSIIVLDTPAARTEAFGQYRVALRANGEEQVLIYTVELSPEKQSVSWKPPESILSDPRIDVLVVAAVTDAVVAFHRGESITFPHAISAAPVGANTAVIRL